MTGPVVDPISGNVLIGSGDAFFASVNPATGAVTKSAQFGSGCGFTSSPIVDIVAGTAYFVVPDTGGTGACPQSGPPAIVQFPTALTAGATGSSRTATGQSSGSAPPSVPALDQAYFSSSTFTGSLYFCMNNPAAKLIQFNILNNSVTGASAPGAKSMATNISTGSSPTPSCRGTTEYFDGTTDRLFANVHTGAVTTSGTYTCGGTGGTAGAAIGSGCAVSFNITTSFTLANATAPQAVLPIAGGGPTAMTIDGKASLPGATQVYFWTVQPQACTGNGTTGSGTGYCAIQASQNGLN